MPRATSQRTFQTCGSVGTVVGIPLIVLGFWLVVLALFYREPSVHPEGMTMAGESSFDVVSEFDRQELVNAVDQAVREVHTRYDLKETGSTIDLRKDEIVLASASEFTLNAVRDVLMTKAVRRGLSLKVFDFQKEEPAAKGTVRQTVKLRRGIDQDLARRITKEIRDSFPKVRPQVQGDALRIFGKSKDDLQRVIQHLKAQDYPVALQFVNYR